MTSWNTLGDVIHEKEFKISIRDFNLSVLIEFE
jgi:hypothetical protein